VSWPHYAQRLLLHYGGFTWLVGQVVYADGVWAVVGELRLGDETYAAVGEDDAPAAAESTAFKRACAKAGIGLHLYGHWWLHERLSGGQDVPPRDTQGPAPLEHPYPTERCPDCLGPLYDNRKDNEVRVAAGKKELPAFKCVRKDECGWITWKPDFFDPVDDDPYDVESYPPDQEPF